MADHSQSTTVEMPSVMPTKRHWISQSTFVKRSRNSPPMTETKAEAMPELDLTAFEGHLDKMNSAAEMIRSQLLRSQDQLGREMAAIRKENQQHRERIHSLTNELNQANWALKESEDKLSRSSAQAKPIPAAVEGVSQPGEGLTQAIRDVIIERKRQDLKWGQQNHRHGMHPTGHTELAERKAKDIFAAAQTIGNLSWKFILEEEIAELFNSAHIEDIRNEAIQVAAVAVALVESLDRNGK